MTFHDHYAHLPDGPQNIVIEFTGKGGATTLDGSEHTVRALLHVLERPCKSHLDAGGY